MDGRQFDQFVRRLAQGESRRSVLKGLLGGAALAAGLGRLQPGSNQVAATSPCPAAEGLAANKLTGTCDAVKSHIQSTGVATRSSGNHPRFAGWTDSTFATLNRLTFDLATEVDPFTNQTCYRPVNLQGVYKVTSKVFVINWQPSVQLSTCCEQERQRWMQAVYVHECRHVSDDHGVVERRNTGMASFVSTDASFRVCGESEGRARNIIKQRILNAASGSLQELIDDADQLAIDFHLAPEGQTPSLDCRKCQTCTSAASGIGASLILADMCCASGPPCGDGCDAVCCADGESCIDGQCQCPEACRPDECCEADGDCCHDEFGTALGCCPPGYTCSINDDVERTCCEGGFDIACPAGGCCISSSNPQCCAGSDVGLPFNFCCPDGYECCNNGGSPGCCEAGAFSAQRQPGTDEADPTPTPIIVEPIIAGGQA